MVLWKGNISWCLLINEFVLWKLLNVQGQVDETFWVGLHWAHNTFRFRWYCRLTYGPFMEVTDAESCEQKETGLQLDTLIRSNNVMAEHVSPHCGIYHFSHTRKPSTESVTCCPLLLHPHLRSPPPFFHCAYPLLPLDLLFSLVRVCLMPRSVLIVHRSKAAFIKMIKHSQTTAKYLKASGRRTWQVTRVAITDPPLYYTILSQRQTYSLPMGHRLLGLWHTGS